MSSLSSRPKLTRESVEAIEDYRQLQSLAKQMDIPANQFEPFAFLTNCVFTLERWKYLKD